MGRRIVESDGEMNDVSKKGWLKGWLYVSGLALLFLLYGLFMFFVVGDRGMPGWDFGTVRDVPGESVYSTHPGPGTGLTEPEKQHVKGRPRLAPPGGEGK